jgi:hypothetical protein
MVKTLERERGNFKKKGGVALKGNPALSSIFLTLSSPQIP